MKDLTNNSFQSNRKELNKLAVLSVPAFITSLISFIYINYRIIIALQLRATDNYISKWNILMLLTLITTIALAQYIYNRFNR